MFDPGVPPAHLENTIMVLQTGGLAHARNALAAGALQVLLADSALTDISLVRSAVAEFGAARVGAWLPVKRMEVDWSLDTQSNGDFKCMVPSNPQARWEVLRSDMQRTGTEAGAWIEKLARLDVTAVLVSVDMQDDRDLDLCAGLIERFGSLLWFSPLGVANADLAAWVEFGQVSRLVLPEGAVGDAGAERLVARLGSPRPAVELAA